jgi:hypothetical protein
MAVHRFRPALHQAHRKAMKSPGIIMNQTLSGSQRSQDNSANEKRRLLRAAAFYEIQNLAKNEIKPARLQ